jgi:hypothetical protein
MHPARVEKIITARASFKRERNMINLLMERDESS